MLARSSAHKSIFLAAGLSKRHRPLPPTSRSSPPWPPLRMIYERPAAAADPAAAPRHLSNARRTHRTHALTFAAPPKQPLRGSRPTPSLTATCGSVLTPTDDGCIGGLETHYKCKITRSPFIHESVAVVIGLVSSPLVRRSPRPRFVSHLERFLPLSLLSSGSRGPFVRPSAAAAESQVFSHLQKSCEPGAEVQFRMKQRRREIKGNIHLISIRLS